MVEQPESGVMLMEQLIVALLLILLILIEAKK